jgi:hypothetical protein
VVPPTPFMAHVWQIIDALGLYMIGQMSSKARGRAKLKVSKTRVS